MQIRKAEVFTKKASQIRAHIKLVRTKKKFLVFSGVNFSIHCSSYMET